MIGPKTGDIVAAIHERDRHRCMCCYRPEDDVDELDIHHIVPRKYGGSHRLGNLITLCRQCHDAAHGHTMAPRVPFDPPSQSDSDCIDLHQQFVSLFDVSRYDKADNCWYIPMGDFKQLLDAVGDATRTDEEKVQAMNDASMFM